MSRSLHVASCYKVKYERVSVYSTQEDEFCRMLCDNCETSWREGDGAGDKLEVEKEDLRNFVKRVKNNPEVIAGYDIKLSPEELVEILVKNITQAEPEDSTIHLEWF